jgi:uncharacterized protein YlxW (UPF0749 family)
MRGEIARLNAAVSALETKVLELKARLSSSAPPASELDQQLPAQIANTIAQTEKLNRSTGWIPFIIGSGLTLALFAVISLVG